MGWLTKWWDIAMIAKSPHKTARQEPIKPSAIPKEPWEEISVDFGGPYPDGHYNLVVLDQRTRYPEVEVVFSTAIKPTKEKLKKIFAHHGIPKQVQSDNGPPFNSKEFAAFAEEEGFQHHRVTPLHPRANGQVERFMQILNKTEQIAHLQGKTGLDRNMAIHDMLMAYRDTPHPATGVTPYQAMSKRPIRTKLSYATLKERSEQDTWWMREISSKRRRWNAVAQTPGSIILLWVTMSCWNRRWLTNGQLPMNLSSIQLSESVDLQLRQGESRMVEKFAETRAILS